MTEIELMNIKTIFEEKNLSKAAEKLFVTQPTLSRSLQKIESNLGACLFKRTNTGLIPTYEGERYYKMANNILKIYNDYKLEIIDIGSLKKGKVTFGTTPQLATYIFPAILPVFKDKYPNIEIITIEMDSQSLEKALINGRIDFAIMFMQPFYEDSNHSNIEFKYLFQDPFLLMSVKDNPINKSAIYKEHFSYGEVDIKNYAKEPFIIGEYGLRISQIAELILHKANINPNIALTTKSFETARRLVSKNYGGSFIPKRYIEIFPSEYEVSYFFIEEKYTPYWNLCIAIQKGSYLSKASQKLMELVKRYIS